MILMVETCKLNKLLDEFKEYGFEDESFQTFVERTKNNGEYITELVNSIGFVTKEDFENTFSKDFINEKFEKLRHSWFKGLNSQVDFGILLECLKEEFKGGGNE
jgi:hypothetical protein